MTTKSDKPNQPAPRYDDVHADGVAWLDELATEVERVRTGPVSAEEALEIAQRFVNGHFHNGKEGPRISIPADPMRDDDLRLVAFIEQSAAEIERLKRDLEGVKEREREHVTRAQDVADEMRRERDAAIAERDELRAQLELVTAENHARAMREAQSLDDWSALRAERDRLRRELESLRKGGEVIIRLRERVRALEGALADVYAAAGVDLDNAPIVNGDWRGAVQMLTNGALTSFVEEIVCATIAERDRLRREVEALRDQARADYALLLTCERDEGALDVTDAHASYRDRLTAILTGAKS